ncbi:ATP-binding protein [Cytobacillus horneckiae]|uniref:ATP-binding protein n=1 Tax=Cytobacillus horneckiae TaxID=549687 RepID=UPI00082570B8|nr:ATP-binding protein [Cytobacillus horneckiae]MCM3177605.1 ATP-binding protein [Cytobacillus horneckiae]MEC1157908.1 ATP-binding protein [Cytobacillus horneckiae]MED2937167.1 ATP-binding protein [Cytobacillus horneckiae]
MYEFINSLILHFFIMMIIPLVKIIIPKNQYPLKSELIFSFFIVVSLILTITYPVEISDTTSFDLKFIPVFIAFFYINNKTGIFTVCLLILLRVHDVHSFLVLLINYSIIVVLLLAIKRYYVNGSLYTKLMIGLLFYVPISITRMVTFISNHQYVNIQNLAIFSFMSIIALTVIIYLIELDEMQREMRRKLQSADKMNAISQLAASVAHEIRNPMTTVKGFMQLMQKDQNLTESQMQYIKISLKELERTNQIIGDFLSLSKPTYILNEKIHLDPLIDEVTNFMKSYAHFSNVSLDYQSAPNLYIDGNPNELKQVLINLIKNAIESMENGGQVEVTVLQEEDIAIISIKDNGIGIPEKQLKELGQPYYSTKSRGTGLGLMIAFDIIKRMEGTYQITSKENTGTTISLHFPVST